MKHGLSCEQLREALAACQKALELTGWVLVDGPRDDHMETYYVYQGLGSEGRLLMNICTQAPPYGPDSGYSINFYSTTEDSMHDYILAKEVLNNPSFQRVSQRISRCCTASIEVYSDGYVDHYIDSVVGHGAWVFKTERKARPELCHK